ncbi:hypothetical protein [Actinokineospora sp. NBRC 105648]|uniref:hypothetical protein n=1 Tax=Actinokineospora sp. NBRC 105648 TaxID=3032206 RepID=UPI00249FDA5F|nr:hypothetical protein [Actinokineospora sp. NBRC 105648]GLZ39933.1 hypothetical protein Acsp05_35570 [Actinokineospora sp. NBRC 105648]
MTQPLDDLLDDGVAVFADELGTLLGGVFADAPNVVVERLDDRRVVRPETPISLRAQGLRLGRLDISVRCRVDSSRSFLAVEKSTMKLSADVDRAPIVRWDYERDAHSKPTAHIQVHGHRGALSHLLARAGHSTPHSMESLHLPVGGARFRPCVEDVIEFLVRDCGMDAEPGWEHLVRGGRARWRRYQAMTVVRDMPETAATALSRLGYTVLPPAGGHPMDEPKALHCW